MAITKRYFTQLTAAFAALLLAICFAACSSYEDPEKIFSGPINDISVETLANGNQAIYFDDPSESTFYKKVDNNGKRVGKWSKDWPNDRERYQGGHSTPYELIFTNGKAYKVRKYEYSLTGEDLSFVESIWEHYCYKYAGNYQKLGYACQWDYDNGSNNLIFDFKEYKVEKADISGFTLSYESNSEFEEWSKVAYHTVHQYYRKTLSNAQLSDYSLFDSRKELYLAMLQIMRAECGDIMDGYGTERYNLAVVEDNIMNDRDPSAGAYINSSDKK
ncbi:MAG: hypothetical protein J6B13_08560 [Muribaculaceae bacterium]|nr:hypothetical protein [Muribaculaceae bacterium]